MEGEDPPDRGPPGPGGMWGGGGNRAESWTTQLGAGIDDSGASRGSLPLLLASSTTEGLQSSGGGDTGGSSSNAGGTGPFRGTKASKPPQKNQEAGSDRSLIIRDHPEPGGGPGPSDWGGDGRFSSKTTGSAPKSSRKSSIPPQKIQQTRSNQPQFIPDPHGPGGGPASADWGGDGGNSSAKKSAPESTTGKAQDPRVKDFVEFEMKLFESVKGTLKHVLCGKADFGSHGCNKPNAQGATRFALTCKACGRKSQLDKALKDAKPAMVEELKALEEEYERVFGLMGPPISKTAAKKEKQREAARSGGSQQTLDAFKVRAHCQRRANTPRHVPTPCRGRPCAAESRPIGRRGTAWR